MLQNSTLRTDLSRETSFFAKSLQEKERRKKTWLVTTVAYSGGEKIGRVERTQIQIIFVKIGQIANDLLRPKIITDLSHIRSKKISVLKISHRIIGLFDLQIFSDPRIVWLYTHNLRKCLSIKILYCRKRLSRRKKPMNSSRPILSTM